MVMKQTWSTADQAMKPDPMPTPTTIEADMLHTYIIRHHLSTSYLGSKRME